MAHRQLRHNTATRRGVAKAIRKCRRVRLQLATGDLSGLAANDFGLHPLVVTSKKSICFLDSRLNVVRKSIDASKLMYAKHVLRAAIEIQGLLVIFSSFQTRVYDGEKLIWASDALHCLDETSELVVFKEKIHFTNKDSSKVVIDFGPLIDSWKISIRHGNERYTAISKPRISSHRSDQYTVCSVTGDLIESVSPETERALNEYRSSVKKDILRNQKCIWQMI